LCGHESGPGKLRERLKITADSLVGMTDKKSKDNGNSGFFAAFRMTNLVREICGAHP
jgi:hypothetical protein